MRIHPDIEKDLEAMGREAVEVIDPSPGLFGGEPIRGLVTIVYKCSENWCRGSGCQLIDGHKLPEGFVGHTHHAVYGPGRDNLGSEGMELYAD